MKSYQSLCAAAAAFRSDVFEKNPDLYGTLSQGQQPTTAFVGCSDSRVIPNLLTNTAPGELFVLRNAGNLIASSERAGYSEAASLEYAVQVLKVSDIIICGHTQCGAVRYRMEHDEGDGALPYVNAWLKQAAELKNRLADRGSSSSLADRWKIAVQENVRVQLAHLVQYPFVESAIGNGKLKVHGWVFELETGGVSIIESQNDEFKPLR